MKIEENGQGEVFRKLLHQSNQLSITDEQSASESEPPSSEIINEESSETKSSLDDESIEDLINSFENFTYRHIEKSDSDNNQNNKSVSKKKSKNSSQKHKHKKIETPKKVLKSVLIILAIIVFCLAALITESLVKQGKNYSVTANRNSSFFPEFSLSRFTSGDFAEDLERSVAYLILDNSNTVRNLFIGKRAEGQTEYNGVYIGKNNRLYLKPADENEEKLSLALNTLNHIASDFSITKKAAIIVPDACYIIPEDLPEIHNVPEQSNQISGIYSELKTNGYECIDVCRLFKKAEDRQSLYFKTDHHWTVRAAELTLNGLAEKWGLDTKVSANAFYTLSNTFRGSLSEKTGIFDPSDKLEICLPDNSTGLYVVENFDTATQTTTLFDKSMLTTDTPYKVFLGGDCSQLTVKSVNDNKMNLLLIKDSFADCFIPLLTPYFGKITVIDPELFRGDITEIIKTENFTHLLVLYNLNGLLQDSSLKYIF